MIGPNRSDRAAFAFRGAGLPASRVLITQVGEDGMSQNALLRSVKGLGIPGTARKEDKKAKLKVAAPAPEEEPAVLATVVEPGELPASADCM